MKSNNVSACGIYNCDGCRYLERGNCPGCTDGNRLLSESEEKQCAVFVCVQSRQLASCNDCSEESCVLKRSIETICPMRSRFENTRWWAGRMARALEPKKRPEKDAEPVEKMSERVVNRLRWYLTALDSLAAEGATSVSSWRLAQKVGVNAALIRKDLSRFGEFGTPSFGYRIDYLSQRLAEILGLNERKGIVWVGAACFRLHCGAVDRLMKHACQVIGVFDGSPEEIGTSVGGHEVMPLDAVGQALSESNVSTAVVAVPGQDAANVARILVDNGVKAILNLSGEMLVLPDSVKVCSFDVMGELLELCYYCR